MLRGELIYAELTDYYVKSNWRYFCITYNNSFNSSPPVTVYCKTYTSYNLHHRVLYREYHFPWTGIFGLLIIRCYKYWVNLHLAWLHPLFVISLLLVIAEINHILSSLFLLYNSEECENIQNMYFKIEFLKYQFSGLVGNF